MSDDELITIVDESDNVVGSEKRSIARRNSQIHRVVRVILKNSRGEILIQQRAASRVDNPLQWDWSAAGHVDAGEEYIEAAIRECFEEVGIANITLALLGKYYDENPLQGYRLRRFTAAFIGTTDQQPHHDPTEVANTRWISPSQLIDWHASKPADFTHSVGLIIELFGKHIFAGGTTSVPVDHSASN